MGNIIARFKKRISTKELLQNIQKNIEELEEYKEHTEQRGRKLVGSLVIYSFVFNFIAAIICYFYYLPPTVKEKLLYATPFIGFVLLINLIKKYLTWYYGWKVGKNERKLLVLKEQKKKVLEDVMETETYKVAKDILETFAPEQFKRPIQTSRSVLSTPINQQRMPGPEDSVIRKRILETPQNSRIIQTPRNRFTSPPAPATPASTPMARMNAGIRAASPTNIGMQTPYLRATPNRLGEYDSGVPPGPPMPRPILPRERGILDRFVEFLVGDGPSNRYALVCKQCESHNGMALKEEFPYIAFRCAYCHYWNPSRKQKPAPPRLEETVTVDVLAKKLAEKESSSDDEEDRETTETDNYSSSSNGFQVLSFTENLNHTPDLDIPAVTKMEVKDDSDAETFSTMKKSPQAVNESSQPTDESPQPTNISSSADCQEETPSSMLSSTSQEELSDPKEVDSSQVTI